MDGGNGILNILRVLDEENAESPIRNDFESFFENDDKPLTFPSSSSSNVDVSTVQKQISEVIVKYRNGSLTNNPGFKIVLVIQKELTENDVRNGSFYFPVEGKTQPTSEAQLIGRAATDKEVLCVDLHGNWWTMKLVCVHYRNNANDIEMPEYYEIDWKAFADYNRLDAGDQIYFKKFTNLPHDLWLVGFRTQEWTKNEVAKDAIHSTANKPSVEETND